MLCFLLVCRLFVHSEQVNVYLLFWTMRCDAIVHCASTGSRVGPYAACRDLWAHLL